MKTMPSSEFRKTFARLDETTTVTVNGHVIGTWLPGGVISLVPDPIDRSAPFLTPVIKQALASPQFRPAPKPGKGK